MNITLKIKSLVLGAAILPAVLWAEPGDPQRFTSTRNPEMNFGVPSGWTCEDSVPPCMWQK